MRVLQHIAPESNTRRDVALLRLYKVLGFIIQKAEGRRQKAEGNPPLKGWDWNKDVLYLAASSLGIIIYFYWALNSELKFLLYFLTFCRLPSALCLFL